MDTTREAFFTACTDARPAKTHYVTLYRDERFYGGPEEGGWYGTDTEAVAWQKFTTKAAAEAAKANVLKLADELTQKAEDTRNRACAAETEWLEARGLDDDFLPHPDGGDSYWVAIEKEPGRMASEGDRHYS